MGMRHESASVQRERFEQVFDEYFRAVSAYALRRARRPHAEEAVAERFLVAWRRLDDVPNDAKRLQTSRCSACASSIPKPPSCRT